MRQRHGAYLHRRAGHGIVSVQIQPLSGPAYTLLPCQKGEVKLGDSLVVDFIARDPDGHLAYFELQAHYDVNLSTDLLALGTLTPCPTPLIGVSPAAQKGPNYAAALGQLAVSPKW